MWATASSKPQRIASEDLKSLWLNPEELACSEQVHKVLLGSRKPSTRATYWEKWKRFSVQSSQQGVPPECTSLQIVLDYLLSLKHQGLALSSIEIHLTAISVFHPKVDSKSLSLLMRRENLTIVTELGDRAAQGRAYGNLGNTHYLLGNFRNAVIAHEQRLLIAKEFGDRAAERRAYSNLGNAYIFLGEFETASEYYKKTLQLARQLKDRAVEAQACYSLGNTYTLLQDYEKAIDYHLKHLTIAQELNDRIGEGRACWSLGNAYTALGNHDQAMHFAEKHLEISREVGDRSGELTARLNLSDLQMVLGLSYSTNNSMMSEIHAVDNSLNGARSRVGRRHSMENMELMKLTPEKIQNWNSDILAKQKPLVAKPSAKLHFVNRLKGKKYKNGKSSKVLQDASNSIDHRLPSSQRKNSPDMTGDEGFFDLLSRFQSNRMDDQRCCFQEKSRMTAAASSSTPPKTMRKSFSTSMVSPHTDEFLDLLASSQSRRLDDQRASFSNLPGLRLNQHNSQSVLGHLMASNNRESDDDFFDILIKCQGSRLDDQRCAPPSTATKGPTVPDEDFFSLILRSQAKRMDEQRVPLPSSIKRLNPNEDF
ncbi:G-protein-signaling modulator 2 [Terrapene carolina triunguis]|uniref:G-protein-signaling modulator 2 n=1 Tax=Terrapene triunguis TaxID=2587831 RepID=UPI001156830B|nr:G-protein-signaling modulator 2 [Terrapene carolina triunguis]